MSRRPATTVDKYVGNRVRMRRMMLGLSQEKLAAAVGLAYQQLQKYEKGSNRISASRLQHLAHILKVPVAFFFEGAPGSGKASRGDAPTSSYVSEYLATSDGLALTKAFMHISNSELRRCIVKLVEAIAGPSETVQ